MNTDEKLKKSKIIAVGNAFIGGGHYAYIAGPCAVESENGLYEIAKAVKAAGATILRAGAYKPRTSPHDFQGLGADGLKIIGTVAKEVGLPTVSEIVDPRDADMFDDIDMLQIGAKNMQNFSLLKEVGKLRKPVLLKRGFCNTLEELLSAAEYILGEGNENVVLCERGIRTFENANRFTLDLGGAARLKGITDLPVIIDPSHASGRSELVAPLALAAAAVGADGIEVETHNDPKRALCDGAQAVLPARFAEIVEKTEKIRKAIL